MRSCLHYRVHIMGINNSCDIILFCNLFYQFVNNQRCYGVETRVWLIAKQIFRVQSNGTCNSYTFLHTSTYLAWIQTKFLWHKVYACKTKLCSLLHLFTCHLCEHLKRKHHITQYCQRIKQCRTLKQHSHLLTQLFHLTPRHINQIASVIQHLPLFWSEKSYY